MIEKLISVSADEYAGIFTKPLTVFGSYAFLELNSRKVEQVRYLIGTDMKKRPVMGIVVGLRDGVWQSPFSAPMAALDWDHEPSVGTVIDFFSLLKSTLTPTPLRVTLPPSFISPSVLTKTTCVISNLSADTSVALNYHYPLAQFPEFEKYLKSNARKNFHRAQGECLIFNQVQISRAYEVIKANRESKGYYLAMSCEDVTTTAGAVHIDAFVLSSGGVDVAAAIVYRIAPGVAHVVYWGDIPGYESMRPMNILPYHVFKYYHEAGFSVVNIGTSSIDGMPNRGLCDFKESLGCVPSLVITATI